MTTVKGARLGEWLAALDGRCLTPEAVDEVWSALSDHVGRSDVWRQKQSGRAPLTGGQLAKRVLIGVPVGALAGMYVTVAEALWIGPWGLMVGAALSTGLGLWARRVPSLRWAAGGWIAGVTFVWAFIGVHVLAARVG